MSASIAWEDPDQSFFARLWTTIWSATTNPIGTFGLLGDEEGSIVAAARFSLVTAAIGWAPYLLLIPCLSLIPLVFTQFMPDEVRAAGTGVVCAVMGGLPFAMLFGSLAVELVHGVVFFTVSRLAGGTATFSASMRAMLYTGAIRFWLFPALFLAFVPFVGWLVQPVWRAGFVIWCGFAAYGAAKGVQHLPDDRAVLVGIATPILAAMISLGIFGAAVFGFVAAFFGTAWLSQHLGQLG